MRDCVPLYQTATTKESGIYLTPNMLEGLHLKVVNAERNDQANKADTPMVFLIKTIE